ncbi:hypothetical protein TrCOL_g5016 [Triparma columacea]|uniref:non-specific serine/threonine protein kinase n=1 Tax=Triparma columacea TaxID=722753 RepID=A0A9W7FWC7_9STRA|nr:hypothetical protein TrCOL_g5016 [Triparma columacea]
MGSGVSVQNNELTQGSGNDAQGADKNDDDDDDRSGLGNLHISDISETPTEIEAHGIVHSRDSESSGNVRPKKRGFTGAGNRRENLEGMVRTALHDVSGGRGGEGGNIGESSDSSGIAASTGSYGSIRSMGNSSTSQSRSKVFSTGLSDFLTKHVLADQDDSLVKAGSSFARKSEAAILAMKMAMDHFMFEGTQNLVRQMFVQELEEKKCLKGDVICRQGEPGDKLYIVESGSISFHIDNAYVGSQSTGGVFGELSLIYGIDRCATAECSSDCVLWELGVRGFRRIQSTLAMQSLENSYRSAQRTLSGLSRESIKFEKEWTRIGVGFNDLEKIDMIGHGTFGCVFRVKNKKTGKIYALKELSKRDLVEANQIFRPVAERNVLRDVNSIFVVKLLDTFSTKNSLFFLTEYVPCGDLMSLMVKLVALQHSVATFFSACIAEAISATHRMGFVHRDIKPENCLVCSNGYVKVADFGLAKRLPAVVEMGKGRTEISLLAFTMCGTPEFMAPEFCMSVGYDKMADWWSFGCVLFEMYMGRGPFDRGGDLKNTFKDICMIGMGKSRLPLHPKFVENYPSAGELLGILLAPVSSRLGNKKSGRVGDHEYFKEVDFEKLRTGDLKSPEVYEETGGGIVLEKVVSVREYDGDQEWCQNF